MVLDELKRGIKEFISGGKLCEENKLFIPASENFFKAILHVVDFFIYKTIGKMPDNHKERFLILEDLNKELYKLVQKLFRIYRKSYRESISKKELEKIKDGFKKTIKIAELEEEFKEVL